MGLQLRALTFLKKSLQFVTIAYCLVLFSFSTALLKISLTQPKPDSLQKAGHAWPVTTHAERCSSSNHASRSQLDGLPRGGGGEPLYGGGGEGHGTNICAPSRIRLKPSGFKFREVTMRRYWRLSMRVSDHQPQYEMIYDKCKDSSGKFGGGHNLVRLTLQTTTAPLMW